MNIDSIRDEVEADGDVWEHPNVRRLALVIASVIWTISWIAVAVRFAVHVGDIGAQLIVVVATSVVAFALPAFEVHRWYQQHR